MQNLIDEPELRRYKILELLIAYKISKLRLLRELWATRYYNILTRNIQLV